MAESFESRLRNELNVCRDEKLYRETRLFDSRLINLSANDYLQLRNNQHVLAAASKIAKKYGTGSGASPLLSGYLPCHEDLVNKLLSWKNKKFGMLFNTGFMANQALLKHLPSKDDLILVDKFIHHSMAQALNSRTQNFKRYNHLDLYQLEELLDKNKNNYENIFVIT